MERRLDVYHGSVLSVNKVLIPVQFWLPCNQCNQGKHEGLRNGNH